MPLSQLFEHCFARENGIIHYSVVSMNHIKKYPLDEKDHPSYISNPQTIILHMWTRQLAGQIGSSILECLCMD